MFCTSNGASPSSNVNELDLAMLIQGGLIQWMIYKDIKSRFPCSSWFLLGEKWKELSVWFQTKFITAGFVRRSIQALMQETWKIDAHWLVLLASTFAEIQSIMPMKCCLDSILSVWFQIDIWNVSLCYPFLFDTVSNSRFRLSSSFLFSVQLLRCRLRHRHRGRSSSRRSGVCTACMYIYI